MAKRMIKLVVVLAILTVVMVGVSSVGGFELIMPNEHYIMFALTWDENPKRECNWYNIYFSKSLKRIYQGGGGHAYTKTNFICLGIKEEDYKDYFFIGVACEDKDGVKSLPAITYHLYGNIFGGPIDGVPVWEAEVNNDDVKALVKNFGKEAAQINDCKTAADLLRERGDDVAIVSDRFDVNGDGIVNAKDRDIVLSRKGKRIPPCSYLPQLCEDCAKKMNCSNR